MRKDQKKNWRERRGETLRYFTEAHKQEKKGESGGGLKQKRRRRAEARQMGAGSC